MVPSEPPPQIVPEIRSFLYPACIMAGIAIRPTTISQAPTVPELAEKIAHMMMTACDRPPGLRPIQTRSARNRRSEMLELSKIAPMKTNSGIWMRTKLPATSTTRPNIWWPKRAPKMP